MKADTLYRIAIFASGSGTNAENFINYFQWHKQINIALILSNKPDAFVLKRAEKHQIPAQLFQRSELYNDQTVINILIKYNINFIVLAGFLLKLPVQLLQNYPNRIINIHPALLPKYGGAGMYGERVHLAVKENRESETGISIHFVNENYDEGKIIFQAKCSIDPDKESAEEIASKVHQLEYEHYPKIVEKLLLHGDFS